MYIKIIAITFLLRSLAKLKKKSTNYSQQLLADLSNLPLQTIQPPIPIQSHFNLHAQKQPYHTYYKSGDIQSQQHYYSYIEIQGTNQIQMIKIPIYAIYAILSALTVVTDSSYFFSDDSKASITVNCQRYRPINFSIVMLLLVITLSSFCFPIHLSSSIIIPDRSR